MTMLTYSTTMVSTKKRITMFRYYWSNTILYHQNQFLVRGTLLRYKWCILSIESKGQSTGYIRCSSLRRFPRSILLLLITIILNPILYFSIFYDRLNMTLMITLTSNLSLALSSIHFLLSIAATIRPLIFHLCFVLRPNDFEIFDSAILF